MWSAYLDLKTYHRRPSEDLQPLDALSGYLVDKAVLWFGIIVENALSERVEIGEGKDKRSEAKYTLEQLLDPAFRLPRPEERKVKRKMVGEQVKALFGMGKPRKSKSKLVPNPLMSKWLAHKGLQ